MTQPTEWTPEIGARVLDTQSVPARKATVVLVRSFRKGYVRVRYDDTGEKSIVASSLWLQPLNVVDELGRLA